MADIEIKQPSLKLVQQDTDAPLEPRSSSAAELAALQNLSLPAARDPESGAISLATIRKLIHEEVAAQQELLTKRLVVGAENIPLQAGGEAPQVMNGIEIGGLGSSSGAGFGSSSSSSQNARAYQHRLDSTELWASSAHALSKAQDKLSRHQYDSGILAEDMLALGKFALAAQAGGCTVAQIENYLTRAAQSIEKVRLGQGVGENGRSVAADMKTKNVSLSNLGPNAEVLVGFDYR